MKLLDHITNRGTLFVLGFSLIAIIAIGFADYLTGHDLAFSLFYVFPIGLVTWTTSRRYGIATAIFGTMAWLAADIQDGYYHDYAFIHVWNAGIRFSFFIIIVFLLSALQKSHEHERELARTDPLTGAANSRYFQELLRAEIDRSQRYKHPFTVIYLDADNFKELNDRFGHSAGDEMLTTIVQYIRANLRRTDPIARLGGDEFAILLTETDETAARAVVTKLQNGLLKLSHSHHWQVTFSLGVLTCQEEICNSDQIISVVDQLMYKAKHEGKNSAVFLSNREASIPMPSATELPPTQKETELS